MKAGRTSTRGRGIRQLAVILAFAASNVEAVTYQYDDLSRLTKVTYESGYTITYEHDAAGNIVRREVGVVPLELAVGILQNPYLTQFLDIYIVAARALKEDAIRLEVADTLVPVQLLDGGENLWKGDYEIQGAGGSIGISACATGFVGAEECLQVSFVSGFVTVADGVSLQSSDTRFVIRIGPGSLRRDAYVLVLPVELGSTFTRFPAKTSALDARTGPDRTGRLASYRVSPPELLSLGASIEISYAGLELPEGTAPEELWIEQAGEGPLRSTVDPQAQVVCATTAKLGDFVLRLGTGGSSQRTNPRFLRVAQNAPNPFNPRTTIRFEVQTSQRVTVELYDVRGRRLTSLFDGVAPRGFTQLVWDGRDANGSEVTSGVYFTRVQSERTAASIRMVLVR